MMRQHKCRLIRIAEVLSRTGLSKSSVYRKMEKEDFPPGVKLGERSRGWYECEVDHWISTRPTAS